MKAVVHTRPLPITDPAALADMELPKPAPGPHDLLVRVHAISVNPVDTKRRRDSAKTDDKPRVLGWDAAGVVEAVGAEAKLFKPGDEVYYAGDVTRPGANSELHCVDERIVGRKPKTLDFPQAAAIPLTAITAWESFHHLMRVEAGKTLLLIGGAGGVGSIGIQLAKIAGLKVIATASRPETIAWCKSLGADQTIDHRKPLPPQLAALGLKYVDYIANFSGDLDGYWDAMAEMIAPFGRMVAIVGNQKPLNNELVRGKSVSFSWEFMFTRARFQADMLEQHKLLNQVADLLDAGKLKCTLKETLSPINAANLRAAHAKLEAGTMVGKLVLKGW
jgi:zinc-binding alcohol dehydrogenase family protein